MNTNRRPLGHIATKQSTSGMAIKPQPRRQRPYEIPHPAMFDDGSSRSRKRTYEAWNRMCADKLRKEALVAVESFNLEPRSQTPPPTPALPQLNADAQSIRSLDTFTTFMTESTGHQSQIGATWKCELITNMNSGFGRGGLRSDGYKGVREGREDATGMPTVRGVGRTGKAPAPVPRSMLDALGVPSDDFSTTESPNMTAEEGHATRQQVQNYGGEILRELQRQRMSEDDIVSQIEVELEKRGHTDESVEEELQSVRADLLQFGEAILRELQWQNRKLSGDGTWEL